MANTQYKFKKSTFSYSGTSEVVAGSDKIENGDIVIALNDKNSPETARMYVKNPFGTAYDTDGDLFPIGTNVDSLTTTKGVKVGTHLRVEGTSKFDGEIDTDSTIELTDQQANKSNTITSNSISFTGQSNDNAATISSDKSLTFNADGYNIVMGSSGIRLYNSSESILFEGDTSNAAAKLTAGNGLWVGTGYASIEMPDSDPYVNINGDTSISGTLDVTDGAEMNSLTVGSRVSVGDGIAPAVNWQGTPTFSSGMHVWHNASSDVAAYGVSIVGATNASEGGVYPQICIYDGTSSNNRMIHLDGEYGNITTSGTVSSSGYVVKNGDNTSFSVGTNGVVFCGGSLTVKNFMSVSMSRSTDPDVYRIYGNSFGHGLFEIGATFSGGDKGHCICYAPNATTSTELGLYRNGAAPRYYICPNKYFSIYTFLDNILYVDFSDYPLTFGAKFLIRN